MLSVVVQPADASRVRVLSEVHQEFQHSAATPGEWPEPRFFFPRSIFVAHCNLVLTLILGANRHERYNETSVLMKCTFWMS